MTIFAGSSHPYLAKELCACTGLAQGKFTLQRFPDAEVSVSIHEDVRGKEVFVLQSTAIRPDEYLMELLVIVDALKRAAASKVHAIIPYFGYCRQDRKEVYGKPITAKLVAKLLTAAGVDHLITLDLHSEQMEGFFEIPVDHYSCQDLLAHWVREHVPTQPVIVAPDLGGVKHGKKMLKTLGSRLVIIDKTRLSPLANEMTLVGDVAGSPVVIFDDLCSTAGTLIGAARLCQEHGASQIIAAVTHPLFGAEARERIEQSPIESLVTTNTVSCMAGGKIQVLSIANFLGEMLQKHFLKEPLGICRE